MTAIPKGFQFAACAAGFKQEGVLDLAAIVSTVPASAGGVFTKNKFQAAPVVQCKDMLTRSGKMSAFIVNSGQANACTGQEGIENCRTTLNMVAKAINVPGDEILPASTGVIGPQLKLDRWEAAMPFLAEVLGLTTPLDAARAIMTTDTFPKLASETVQIGSGDVTVMGMCKGAGMISPDMATMLGFICCDAGIEPEEWQSIIARCADLSFNKVTVDGDTSTNDCIMGLANGESGVNVESAEDLNALEAVVLRVMRELAYMIVQDAEGGTKVARILVKGAVSDEDADRMARSIGNSPLVKTALFGQDANWGRIVMAAGKSRAEFDPQKLILRIGDVVIFRDGQPAPGNMDELLEPVMAERDIPITIELGDGEGTCELLASDLTKEYISINADYRS